MVSGSSSASGRDLVESTLRPLLAAEARPCKLRRGAKRVSPISESGAGLTAEIASGWSSLRLRRRRVSCQVWAAIPSCWQFLRTSQNCLRGLSDFVRNGSVAAWQRGVFLAEPACVSPMSSCVGAQTPSPSSNLELWRLSHYKPDNPVTLAAATAGTHT